MGVVHAHTFHFDAQVPYMIGIYYLLAYEGGEVQPGDDMRDALYRWWSLEPLIASNARLITSSSKKMSMLFAEMAALDALPV